MVRVLSTIFRDEESETNDSTTLRKQYWKETLIMTRIKLFIAY